jgi:transposase InsO family protein
MDGLTTSLAAQRAIETFTKGPDREPGVTPESRTDNGSGFVSKEFRVVLKENGLTHQRIQPHCPEQNGLIERFYRAIQEDLEGDELSKYVATERVMARLVHRYNHERLQSASGVSSALGVLPGQPAGAIRATAGQAVPSSAPSPGAKPRTASGNLTTRRRGDHYFRLRSVCPTSVETLQNWLLLLIFIFYI